MEVDCESAIRYRGCAEDDGDPSQAYADFLPDEQLFRTKVALLTPTHREILALTARGHLNKEIAWLRGSTEGTIKRQQQEILRRLEMRSRTQAAVKFAVYQERLRAQDTPPTEKPDCHRLQERRASTSYCPTRQSARRLALEE